jgi:hypothetical protein
MDESARDFITGWRKVQEKPIPDVDQAYLFRVVRGRTTWVVKEHEVL